jgi:hypothetical protein
MKNHRIPFLLFLAAVYLSACTEKQKNEGKNDTVAFKRVSINQGEYSMDVPEYMSKASSLNDGASLQYQNLFKEAYVIVIDENKDLYIKTYKEMSVYDTTRSVISNYMDTQIQSTTNTLDVISKSKISSFNANGVKAKSVEIDANLEGVSAPITYFITCIEGKDKLYLVMAWTMQNRKDTHRDTFNRMVRTFREKTS